MPLRFLPVLLFLPLCIYAEVLSLGDSISSFSLPDQFDRVHQVNTQRYKTLFIAFEKDVGTRLNELLQEKPVSFLQNHKALFISDIHTIPSFVIKMFVLPKMQEYAYPLLLIYKEKELFPKKEDALTVIKIGDKTINEIFFVREKEKIKRVLDRLDFKPLRGK